jgi:ABC-2 type transport system permease protein
MNPIFRHTLRRYRGQVIGWGIGMFLLGLMAIPLWDITLKERATVEVMVRKMPPGLKAVMPDLDNMFEPAGFLNVRFFALMPLILGVYAVLGGSGLIASDEENGTLDLVQAHPVSRSELFLGRFAAFAAATAGILGIAWLGLVVPMSWSTLDVGWGELALAFLSLLGVLLLYTTLALLLSLVLPSRRLAAMAAGMVVVGSYFVSTLARLNSNLELLARLSPLDYYQGGDAIHGLNVLWLAGLLAVSAVFAGLAWWRFQRRDIRVAGEGSWSWPWQRAQRAT